MLSRVITRRARWSRLGLPLLGVLGSLAFALLAGATPLEPLPGSRTDTHATATPTSAHDGQERARLGIVTIVVSGRTTGLGAVLGGDGRILSALSALRGGDHAEVRYADGHVVHVRVGHKDAAWDLALLVPLAGRWTQGLFASELDPLTTELHAYSLAGARPSLVAAKYKDRVDGKAKDGTVLPSLIELEGRPPPLGSPVLDSAYNSVGIEVHVCKQVDGGSCVPLAAIAPVPALRAFLARTPADAVPPSPWLGINGVPESVGSARGVRIMAVAPRSPAQRGGLKGSTSAAQADVIVAADGQPVDTPERLAEIISKHAVGDTVKLKVFSHGKFREVRITLQAPP